MSSTRLPLNPFERMLFGIAVVLGLTLILFRLGAVVLMSYLHHTR